jgi:hypothetical protein
MEDALWAQLQNTSLEEHDDRDRIEAETDSEQDEGDQDDSRDDESVSALYFTPQPTLYMCSFSLPFFFFFFFYKS